MEGWIKLYRKISDNYLWLSEKFTRGQAWVDLILLANHKDNIMRVRGVKVDIKRGQCGWSEQSLADRWQWSRGKVRRFLNELETEQQIVQQKNNVISIITISNYSEYQGNGTADSTTNGTTNGHQTVQQTDINKNDKNIYNEKTEKKITPPTPTWKTDFQIYLNDLNKAVRELISDSDFVAQQERFNPNVDILLTIEKLVNNYWGTDTGWKNKKSKRTASINWKSTITNAISQPQNRVYKNNTYKGAYNESNRTLEQSRSGQERVFKINQ